MRNILKILLLFVFLLFCKEIPSYAQSASKTDSLLNAIYAAQEDTTKVNLLNELAFQLKHKESLQALKFARQAQQLSRKLNFKNGAAYSYFNMGVIYNIQSKYDSSLLSYDSCMAIARKLNDLQQIQQVHHNLGILYHNKGDYEKALLYYLKALNGIGIKYKTSLARTYNNIGNVHEALKNQQQALYYYSQSLALHKEMGNKDYIAGTSINIGVIHANLKNYEKALEFYAAGQKIAEESGNYSNLSIVYENIGNVYKNKKQYDKALSYYKKGLSASKKVDDQYGIASICKNIGETLIRQGQYQKAIEYLNNTIKVSKQIGSATNQVDAYYHLSAAYAIMLDYPKAYSYHQQFSELKDSLFNEKKTKQINELQAKYESERKEKEIALLKGSQEQQQSKLQQQQAQLQLQATIRNGLVIVSGLLLLLALAIYWIFRQKIKNNALIAKKNDEINRQKILELEKNQKLLSLDAMIAGQEAERKRIAKDLHDGLGGLLSTVKLHFNTIQTEIDKIHSLNVYGKANSLLDEACMEVRKIAHNMMPGALSKFGLVSAIGDICSTINKSEEVKVEFQCFGLERRLDESTEVMVYRIIQELINNIIKHAEASEVIVQLTAGEHSLSITVEDDGKGFDVGLAKAVGGMGIRNVESRVNYLNGQLTIVSAPGKGTTFSIDIPITTPVSTT